MPYSRSITVNQTSYFSAKACGLALEVGVFNDSLCSSLVSVESIFNGRCISDGRSSSSPSVRAVCTSSPAPNPPPSSPFSGDFSVSLYSDRGCSDNGTSPIVGNGSSCLPFLALGQGFVYYMSASACGQTFFEIGLFADSFCNRSDAQTIYIQIPNNQTRCSSISPRVFASAVCTSSPPPVAPADTSPGSSSGTASPGVIAGSVVGAIACKRRNYNPAHSLVTFDPNTALSLCLSLIVRVSCRLGVCSVLAAKSVRHLLNELLRHSFALYSRFYAMQS